MRNSLLLDHVVATSNDAERLFSTCKHCFNDLRKRLTPYHLETELMLKLNDDLWDARIISRIRNRPNPPLLNANAEIDGEINIRIFDFFNIEEVEYPENEEE